MLLDIDQVQPSRPALLRSARRARVVGVRGKGRTQRTVFLSVDARRALAGYLEVERPFDATDESTALFLSAVSVSSRPPTGGSPGAVSTPSSNVSAGSTTRNTPNPYGSTYAWWREHNPEAGQFPADRNLSRYDLFKMFTLVRSEDPRWAAVDTRVGRGVICRFDRTTKSFYKRCSREGTKPGYPRFKPRHRWRSIEIVNAGAQMLVPPGPGGRWWRLRVKGVPAARFCDGNGRLAAALDAGTVVELWVVRTPLRVELHVVVGHDADTTVVSAPLNPVGIDKGLSTRMALSDGRYVPARTIDNQVVRRYQRRLARAQRGSRSRAKKRAAVARVRRRETERARAADFRLAHDLVTSFDGVAVEDLNIAGLLRSRRYSKKMSEQRWGTFDLVLGHKAEKAGVPYVKVSPSHTSTDCSRCGHRQPMPLGTRVYRCGSCRLSLCRDVNAARNICARAFPQVRGREGPPPDAARYTNNHRETDSPPRAGTQVVAAEQYA